MDLVRDSLVDELKNIEIAYIEGPPKTGETAPAKIRAAFIPRKARTKSRGSFLLSPGRTEYIEKYARTILELTSRGYNVMTVDHRGQGMSDRMGRHNQSGDIDDFANMTTHFANAFTHFADKMTPPHYLISHSMGGMIALDLLLKNLVPSIEKAVFNAPMFWLSPFPAFRAMVQSLCAIGLAGHAAPTLRDRWRPWEFATNDVTSDSANFARNNALMLKDARLQLGGATNNWIKSAFKMMSQFTNSAVKELKIPMLMIIAGNENIVDNEAIYRIGNAIPNCTLKCIDGAMHEILVEKEEYRQVWWQYFDEFMTS